MSKLEQLLTQIAQSKLGIETLQTRNSDSLDFHDTAVWCLKDALEAAFKAGVELGASMPKATEAEIAWLASRTARSSHRHQPPRRSSK